ncbi:unnamed protein product, partial [Cladocopium goreaui]
FLLAAEAVAKAALPTTALPGKSSFFPASSRNRCEDTGKLLSFGGCRRNRCGGTLFSVSGYSRKSCGGSPANDGVSSYLGKVSPSFGPDDWAGQLWYGSLVQVSPSSFPGNDRVCHLSWFFGSGFGISKEASSAAAASYACWSG